MADTRTERITTRLSPAELAAFTAAAGRRNVSAYFRDCAIRGLMEDLKTEQEKR